jgi:hypothetical protein
VTGGCAGSTPGSMDLPQVPSIGGWYGILRERLSGCYKNSVNSKQ